MKIAYNPSTAQPLTTVPDDNVKDIIFDLSGRAIFARGIKFEGIKYEIFTLAQSEGLVPTPSKSDIPTRYLREDGTWVDLTSLFIDLSEWEEYD